VSNVFIGNTSGGANTTGNRNTTIGRLSGAANTTGSDNTFLGYQSGRYITGGVTGNTISNNSIFIGYDTRAAADNETNQIVIGYQETGLGSNTTIIGNASTVTTALRGNLLLGTTSTTGARATVRGSGTTSSTTALLVQNSTPSELFKVLDNGVISFGLSQTFTSSGTYESFGSNITFTNSTVSALNLIASFSSTIGFSGTQGYFNSRVISQTANVNNTSTSNNITCGYFSTRTSSSGAGSSLRAITGDFQIEGTGNVTNATVLDLSWTKSNTSTITNAYGVRINNLTNTGGTITNTYGIYIGDITAGTQTNTPYAIYSEDASAVSYIAGNTAIGTSTLQSAVLTIGGAGTQERGISINRTFTGGTSRFGILQYNTVNSDVTSTAINNYSQFATQAAAFTLTNARHYTIADIALGAGSAVTNQVGFYCGTLSSATNNYAFQGVITAGTDRWNLYMNGTAANYLAGDTAIGTTTTSGGRLTVRGSGTTSAANSLLVEDSAGTDTFVVRNDGGYAFKGGTVGLAQTGYTTFTNLTTDRTCDANSTTVEELADILGTLIEDLKTKGIISA
jgi:hypothetical protein